MITNWKNIFICFLAAGSLITTLSVQSEEKILYEIGLEPCINGGVSKSGIFPTQAMEDELRKIIEWMQKNELDVNKTFELAITVLSGSKSEHQNQ